MIKVVSSVPESRFEQYDISWPEDWALVYFAESEMAPPYSKKLLDASRDADFVFVGSMHPVTEEYINNLESCRLLHVEGVSFDRVDIAAAAKKGIYVCNNQGVNKGSVAEHCIGMMLSCVKKIHYFDRKIREIGYAAADVEFLMEGTADISEMTIGMIGMGGIGKEVARRLSAWDCSLLYYDPIPQSEELERKYGMRRVSLEELLRQSDAVTIHLPVIESTTGMIGREQLEMMKNDAVLVNVARGAVIDQDALIWALENDEIGFAALDTVDPEPMPDDHPLLCMSKKARRKTLLTTHAAGKTRDDFRRMLKWATENFVRVEQGERPNNIVNGL